MSLTRPKEIIDPASAAPDGQYVTFVHAKSESSDDYYLAFDGIQTYATVEAEIQENWHDLYVDEPDYMHIESLLCARVR